MKPRSLAAEMVRAAERLGWSVRMVPAETIKGDAAPATIKGERVLFVRKGLSPEQKIAALAAILARDDLDDVYLKPVVREAIEKERDCRT